MSVESSLQAAKVKFVGLLLHWPNTVLVSFKITLSQASKCNLTSEMCQNVNDKNFNVCAANIYALSLLW